MDDSKWESHLGMHPLVAAADSTCQCTPTDVRLRLANSLFTHTREGILITDHDGIILDVNDSFSRITGYHREEVLGQTPRLLKSGCQGPEFYAALWRHLLEDGHWHGEIWNRRKSGELYPELLTIRAVHDTQGKTQYYVALFSDITAQKEHQRQLERIVHYDPLTGLPNRVLLADRLQQAMAQVRRRGQCLAVAYLDLDSFKDINNTYGHDIGDQLLITLARRLEVTVREGDTIARLGGDEFVAVVLDLDDDQASLPLLARLLEVTAQPVPMGDLSLRVSASVGVTYYPQADDVDADQLLRQGDQAMYQAKLAGKNRFHVFDAEQDRNTRGQHANLEQVRSGLDRREFVLHYQPKVNMRSGEVIGAEALIRWQHPDHGLLSPIRFLPAIESHALAVDVGVWVMDAALTQLEAWHASGLKISVSVNVGAYQLQQADFMERLHALLAAHPNVHPCFLELEVVESSALRDMAQVSQVMHACREIGVGFALDDFGTGYASLTYLKRLPAASIKIDQTFVRDMLDDPDDLSILEGVVGMAMAFQRQVIAEGVETMDHGMLLLQLGCELAQGYGIAPPMPAAALPGWVEEWRPHAPWSNEPKVNRGDLPVIIAQVEHRAWLRALEDYLSHRRRAPPPRHHRECRFGHWLYGEGQARHGWKGIFPTIVAQHRKLHDRASELLLLKEQGNHQEALARLNDIRLIGDRLFEQLRNLMQQCPC